MVLEILATITTSLLGLIDSLGYVGIFILMTIESSFIPFPAELIVIPAGALVAAGQMHWLPALIAATLGSVVGAYINYYIALHIGRRATEHLISKYGKFVFLTVDGLKKTDVFFHKHGSITTFIGRLIPGIRSFISFPAGFTKMSHGKFIGYTALGAGIWCALLLFLGYTLQTNSELISQYLKQITIVVVIVCVILIGVYLWYHNHNKSTKVTKAKK